MQLIKNAIVVALWFARAVLAEENCVSLKNPKHTNASSKVAITMPGNYCLSEDLHARIDFADHPAEPRLIDIWSGDVVLDLGGNTLGRGRFFRNPGGVGIEFHEGVQNVTIKSGTIQDFYYGIDNSVPIFRGAAIRVEPNYDARTNTYRFERDNIVIQNIRFKNNRIDMFFEQRN